jgi:lipoprotein
MKKIAFSLVLVLATAMVFTSCNNKDNTLRDNIVKNLTYSGTDNDKSNWVAQFTATTFTATCSELKIVMVSNNWSVTENTGGKTGSITITGVKNSDNGKALADISGTIAKNGDEIVLKQNNLTITLTKGNKSKK